jgi:class 3 adenylate cyclase
MFAVMTTDPAMDENGRNGLRVPIATALMTGFGLLVLVGMAGVLAVVLWSARENTRTLLADKAELANEWMLGELRRHLDPVLEGNAYIADLVARGDIDPAERLQLVDFMTGAMAATPQILGMGYISPDLEVVRVSRSAKRLGVSVTNQRNNAQFRGALEDAMGQTGPHWGQLLWNPDLKLTMINLRSALRHDGRSLGMLVSVLSVSELSRRLAERAVHTDIPDRFVLYGSDYVLAHQTMADGNYPRAERQPIPSLEQIGDPVIAKLWDQNARSPLLIDLRGETRGHVIEHQGDYYPVIYRTVTGYGPVPLTVGAYIRPDSGLDSEIKRLRNAGIAGLAMLVITVVAALVLGRRISRPVRHLAGAARQMAALDFSPQAGPQRSRLSELDDAARAFNAMRVGLRWFETYVPKALARRLITEGDQSTLESEEREITVMFTDITGFSSLAERLNPEETADLLNAHFSLVTACIEAEDGIVDKFIGDSVMAFWGTPSDRADRNQRACRAALATRRAMAADNADRTARGAAPLHTRIGIHTGPALIGNIGAPGRINYTVVGDTVNVAQRLEDLGRTVWAAGEDAVILVSEDVAQSVEDVHRLSERGTQEIRGRDGGLKIYKLEE